MVDSTDKERPASSVPAIGHMPYALFLRLPADFSIEVETACLSGFDFPGLQQRCLPVLSHFDNEVHEA